MSSAAEKAAQIAAIMGAKSPRKPPAFALDTPPLASPASPERRKARPTAIPKNDAPTVSTILSQGRIGG